MTDIARYEQAAALLPPRFRSAALSLADWKKPLVEEFRLRAGTPVTLLTAEGEMLLPYYGSDAFLTPKDLEHMVDALTEHSRYACSETLRQGYLPLRGGYRLGLCGSGVIREGRCVELRSFSSLALRIPRECLGVAAPLLAQLFEGGGFQSTLVLSPPGGGKTTLLRDMIRALSAGGEERRALRVGVIDERGEIAAVSGGQIQMSLGPHTDVLDGVTKAEGIPMLLRAMNPQVIAVDEITAQEDVSCMLQAANCGTTILATMHAENMEELRRKPLYAALAQAGVFCKAITIGRCGQRRDYHVEAFA